MTVTAADLSKGFASGLLAGLAGAWIMGEFHALVLRISGTAPPASEQDPTEKTAAAISERVFHRTLSREEQKAAGSAVHYAFGGSMAALYEAAAEIAPGVTRDAGLPFGITVWLGAHTIAVPALGLAPPITRPPAQLETVEFAAPLVYGAVTEMLRRLLRGRRADRSRKGLEAPRANEAKVAQRIRARAGSRRTSHTPDSGQRPFLDSR